MKFKIYCLRHPITLEIKYIGRTSTTLKKRLNSHMSDRNRIVSNWIQELLSKSLKPDIELLEETNDIYREDFWIQYFRNLGCNLINVSNGMKHSELSKIKCGANNVGKSLSEEHKNKISLKSKGENNGFFGKTHSEEVRQRISNARKNTPWTEARRLTQNRRK